MLIVCVHKKCLGRNINSFKLWTNYKSIVTFLILDVTNTVSSASSGSFLELCNLRHALWHELWPSPLHSRSPQERSRPPGWPGGPAAHSGHPGTCWCPGFGAAVRRWTVSYGGSVCWRRRRHCRRRGVASRGGSPGWHRGWSQRCSGGGSHTPGWGGAPSKTASSPTCGYLQRWWSAVRAAAASWPWCHFLLEKLPGLNSFRPSLVENRAPTQLDSQKYFSKIWFTDFSAFSFQMRWHQGQ